MSSVSIFFYVPGYICHSSFTRSKFEYINKSPPEGRRPHQLIDFDETLVGMIEHNAPCNMSIPVVLDEHRIRLKSP